ncbi:hypothetical protein EDB83DRAFT_2392684 [Lactarius deliciosus]|nr:hypothetical protein EDB83DRAFT_2392684 [Lactarius deliciosus]
MASKILGPIRDVYLALHQDTDAAPTRFSTSTSLLDDILFDPTSYPLCDIPGHCPDSTPHIHNVSAPMTFPRAVLHRDAALVPASLSSTPDAPSSSVLTPLRIYENLAYVLPPDNNTPVAASLQPAYQSPIESSHIPATPPDLVTTCADIVTGITIPHPTPETSTSALALPSTFPPAAVAAVRPNLRAPSDAPDLPSSAYYPVPDNTLPTDQPPFPHITSSGLSPRVSSFNNNFQPQSPSLSSVPDLEVAIAAHSLREPNAERTGDHLPRP